MTCEHLTVALSQLDSIIVDYKDVANYLDLTISSPAVQDTWVLDWSIKQWQEISASEAERLSGQCELRRLSRIGLICKQDAVIQQELEAPKKL